MVELLARARLALSFVSAFDTSRLALLGAATESTTDRQFESAGARAASGMRVPEGGTTVTIALASADDGGQLSPS